MNVERGIKQKMDLAVHCIPFGQRSTNRETYVNHRGYDLTPARRYLRERGCDPEIIDRILNADGYLALKDVDTEIDPYSLSPEGFNVYLAEKFEPIYQLVDASLEGSHANGFNRHGEEHIDSVTKRVLSLLESKGASEDTLRRAVAAARGHDLGNLFSRDAHAVISPELFRRLIPGIARDQKQWSIIRRAILFHDPDISRTVINSWGILPADKRLTKMSTFFGDEALALIIADKTDIGPGRLSKTKTRVNDPHAEINLLGRTDSIGVTPDGVFRWDLFFNPYLTEEDVAKYPHLVRELNRQRGIDVQSTPFDIWANFFWTTYLERVLLTVEAAFALYPSIQRVEIVMHENGLSERKQRFRRDILDQNIATVRGQYTKKVRSK